MRKVMLASAGIAIGLLLLPRVRKEISAAGKEFAQLYQQRVAEISAALTTVEEN